MNNFERYFPGEAEWIKFAYSFKNEWGICPNEDEIIRHLNGNKDIAMVAFGINFETTLEWIDTKIPALNNLTPKECLNDSLLMNRLKSMLMRMEKNYKA